MLFNYKAKNSQKFPFIVSYLKSNYEYYYNILSHWITKLRLSPGLNFLNLKLDEVSKKLYLKYEVSYIFDSGSEENKIKWLKEIIDETNSLTKSNFLLYFSLLFKYMRPLFVGFYWEAKLIKLDGSII